MATLTELIRQEDPKRPYTDEQLAQMLQLRREQVVEQRRINGIPNSWMRLRPALVVEMQKLLEQEPGLSDRSLTLRLNAMGYNVSRYLVKELHSNLPEKEAEPQPEPAVEITTQEETEDTNVFAGMIGYDGGLKAQIHQAKAAVSYPPNGLHTLIIGPSGSGKTFLAENMYHYAVQQGLLAPDAPFVSFNCADYADNPQLLNSRCLAMCAARSAAPTPPRTAWCRRQTAASCFWMRSTVCPGKGRKCFSTCWTRAATADLAIPARHARSMCG